MFTSSADRERFVDSLYDGLIFLGVTLEEMVEKAVEMASYNGHVDKCSTHQVVRDLYMQAAILDIAREHELIEW